jgi:hypothetical protein
VNPFDKISSIPPVYWLWGGLVLFLLSHFAWCQLAAYPAAFERQLRQGKSWVYIPRRWKGFNKFAVLWLSRGLMLGMVGAGTALVIHYTERRLPSWIAGFVAVALWVAATRLDALWTNLRYRQQEDAYYRLHDELREKLDQDGKDYTETQFRSLAAYQHQQRLHKADESGEFLTVLRREAGRARQAPALNEPGKA